MATRFFGVSDIEAIDLGKLTEQLPGRPRWNPFSTQGQYIKAILASQQMLEGYGINTALRLAHFIGQGLVETGWFSAKVESTNYSYEALKATWSHKFASDEEMRAFARHPERIANRIYGSRVDLGNGPEESGDGWRYRGRGFFQLTGRDNYRRYGEMAGIDLVSDPEILERDIQVSLQVAAAYFDRTGLGPYADRNEVSAVSRGVNRGDPQSRRPANHEAQRIEWTAKAITLVRDPASLQLGAGAGPVANDDALRIGSTGDDVKAVQRALTALGYAAGADDGIFGPATRRAILAFQDEHGLSGTGVADQVTRAALAGARDGETAPPTSRDPPPVQGSSSEPPLAPPPPAVASIDASPVVSETAPAVAPETPTLIEMNTPAAPSQDESRATQPTEAPTAPSSQDDPQHLAAELSAPEVPEASLVSPALPPALPIEPPAASTTTSDFASKLLAFCQQEWEFFGRGALKETEEPAKSRIAHYWTNVGKEGWDGETPEPWSAAFISYAVKEAGDDGRFKKSALHAVYINDAISRKDDPAAPFQGKCIEEHAPRLGDLIARRRGGSMVTYDTAVATGEYKSHTDIVTAIKADHVEMIGGNLSNSVTVRSLPLLPDGRLEPGAARQEGVFAILRCNL